MDRSVKSVEQALWNTGGFISQAAKQLHMSQGSLSNRIKRSPSLQKTRAEIEEAYLDLAETKLISSIKRGSLGAICFYLKCKGKGRGYIEQPANNQDDLSTAEITESDMSNLSDDELQELNSLIKKTQLKRDAIDIEPKQEMQAIDYIKKANE